MKEDIMFNFEGKVVLITGAAGGIGQALAHTFYEGGATLALTDMTKEGLEAVQKQFDKKRAFIYTCNLGEAEAPKKLVEDVEKELGKIDVLVNNAGLTRDGLFIRMSDEDWNLVLNVNLTAGFRLARSTVRGMMKRRYGRIISMASVVGVMGNAGQANYSASKAGLIGMSKCLAQEVASRGVTVNTVAPGFIKTRMTDVLPDEAKERLISSIPASRLGTAQDVANAVAFLASDEAAYITGQTIHVNGGMAMI